MKKIITMVLIAVLAVTVAGCAERTIAPAVPVDEYGRRDTPVRVGNGTSSSRYAGEHSLDMAIENSDIIADITIIEWLGETSNTFFLARVNQTLKGGNFEEIEIIQVGNSIATDEGFPLFKNGNRFLAFLRKSSAQEGKHKGRYWVCITTLLDVLEHEKEPYLISRWHDFDQDLVENNNLRKIEGKLRSSVNEEFAKYDPVLAEVRGIAVETNKDLELDKFIEEEKRRNGIEHVPSEKQSHRDVFSYDEVVEIITHRLKEGGE